ncbi:MAG: trypsin-like cysteine/serine peptidase domain-containing protein [Benjaminiella poitrasii]|nr:MAG: trypsin-like cysteine/serine peptidase domain-containing protein [Benjaminiella poitrasii]
MIGSPRLCGGTLISYDPAYVLTAAHCFLDDSNSTEHYAVIDNTTVAIANYTLHPLYPLSAQNELVFDAAIVRLTAPLVPSSTIRHATFLSVQQSASLLSKQGELIGLGYLDMDGNTASTLRQLPLNITSVNMTIEAQNEIKALACHGDSGGPLVVYQDDGRPFVAGELVRIFGAYDPVPQRPTCPLHVGTEVKEVFTNVGHLLDWITNVTGMSRANLIDPLHTPPYYSKNKVTEKLMKQPHG